MKSADIAVLMEGIAPVLRDLVAKAIAPALERLEAIEKRPDPVVVVDVETIAARAVEKMPKAPTAEEVAALVGPPQAGRDGVDGKDGAPGRDGDAGAAGRDGTDGEKGDTGAPGADGVGLAGALIDRDGNLVLTLTDGKTVALGIVVGKDGAPGRDGLGFDDLEVTDAGTTFTLAFRRGEQRREFTLAKPTLADSYQGVWKEASYDAGDVVTWGGSLWLAKADTEAKPESNADWVLVVKRGRDGKDGELKAPRAPAAVKL